MKKIEVSLKDIKEIIKKFYNPKEWHFLTLNGVAIDEKIFEIEWIFSKYNALDEIIIYFALISYKETIPSIADIIPSAIISQREIVDMFGVEVEHSKKGLYLDEDSQQMPLSRCKI